MARKPATEGGKKEALITTALKLFMENGYENTSVRMILNEVGGEVGMFYHYFKSKDALFEASIAYYFQKYAENFSLITTDTNLPIQVILERIFTLFQSVANSYLAVRGRLHWTVETALRQKTLEALEPSIAALLQRATETGILQQPDVTFQELAAFLIHGVAGFVHQQPVNELTAEFFSGKKHGVVRLIANVLNIDAKLLERKIR